MTNEVERLRQQDRRLKELLKQTREAKGMVKSGDLAGAAERLAENVAELATILKEEIEHRDKR